MMRLRVGPDARIAIETESLIMFHPFSSHTGPEKRTPQARFFIDDDYFKTEMQRWFVSHWVFAGRVEEVPAAGDYILRTVAGESVLITRGRDGQVRAFFNICTHRGTILVESEAGSAVSCQFSCPYHAWSFDCNGALLGAPGMKGVAGFAEKDWGLRPVGCEEWAGFIFIYLGPNPPALADSMADMPEKFAHWPMGEMQLAARLEYDVAANWKLIVGNYSECLHCPSVHPALARLSPPTSGENDPPNHCYMGGRMSLNDGVASMTVTGASARPLIASLNEMEKRHVYYYAWLPNMLLSLHPDYCMTHRLEPVGPGRTKIICEFLFEKFTIARPDFQTDDAVAFWDLTNRQDWHVSELTQRGLASRGYRPGPYSNREHLLFDLDQVLIPRDE